MSTVELVFLRDSTLNWDQAWKVSVQIGTQNVSNSRHSLSTAPLQLSLLQQWIYVLFVPNSSCEAEFLPEHTGPALIVFKTSGEVKKGYCTKPVVFQVIMPFTSPAEAVTQYWLQCCKRHSLYQTDRSTRTLNTSYSFKSRNPRGSRSADPFPSPCVTFWPLNKATFQLHFLIIYLSATEQVKYFPRMCCISNSIRKMRVWNHSLYYPSPKSDLL